MARKPDRSGTVQIGFPLAVAIALGLAIGVSLLITPLVVAPIDIRLVVGVAAGMALLAAVSPGTVTEALVLALVLGGVSSLALLHLPLPPFWQQVWVAGYCGLCTSMLVLGAHDEFFQPLSSPSPSTEDAPGRSAHGQSAPGVREYDSVRVVRLRTRTRPFDGTAPMARLPRVGDIATVAHEYDPDDPGGTVAVEMTDADGLTIWLADFDRDELECIDRPGPG